MPISAAILLTTADPTTAASATLAMAAARSGVTSAIAGYVIFNELPDRWSALGAVLIAGSGLYALHREAVRQRAVTASVTPAA